MGKARPPQFKPYATLKVNGAWLCAIADSSLLLADPGKRAVSKESPAERARAAAMQLADQGARCYKQRLGADRYATQRQHFGNGGGRAGGDGGLHESIEQTVV